MLTGSLEKVKHRQATAFCQKEKEVLQVLNLLRSLTAMLIKLRNARQVLNDPSSLEKNNQELAYSFGKHMIVQQTLQKQ